MSQPSSTNQSGKIETLTIVGVGLIGGSIAAAVKQRGLARRIIGVGRNLKRLQAAQQAGLIDDCRVDLKEAAGDSDFIVFCTPVDRIVPGIREAAAHCRPGTVMTDGGSTKQRICDEAATALPAGVHFVGSHPLAGSEKQGHAHADAELFAGRVCVITPHKGADKDAVARVNAFWEGLGCDVREMSPQLHDEILAETSHVPHLIASALAATLRDDNRPYTAGGFRDTTRIAAGDEQLWAAIFLSNREALLAGLDRFEEQLSNLREAVAAGNVEQLRELLGRGRANRSHL